MGEPDLKLRLPPQWVYWAMAILGVAGVVIVVAVWLWIRNKGEKKE